MSTETKSDAKPTEKTGKNEYKDTLHLPQTDFAMKADLAKREPDVLRRWDEMKLYDKVLEKNAGRPEFRLHDGPPYANGSIHIGHMLNKILKDITLKYRAMAGYTVSYVPGWDTHGLPIEHQVDKDLGDKRHSMTAVEKRAECERYARKWIDVQRNDFKRLGIFGEWDKPYLTLNKDYEAAIIRVLAKFADHGSLVRGKKPVYWSWAAETALAEAEVEYEDHTSPSIYVKYPIQHGVPQGFAHFLEREKVTAYAVIWTTTPWTLPASLAISVGPEVEYVIAKIKNRKGVTEAVVMADKLLPEVAKAAGFEVLATSEAVKGTELATMLSKHPFIADRQIPTLVGDHVTLDAGTGLVHTAPGHGPDDYIIGLKYGLPPLAPVNGKGLFTAEAGKYEGMHVFKQGNPTIVADLDAADALLNPPDQKLTHSYPHCWRTHTPAIFRATPQWFISMQNNDLRQKALAEIDRVRWIPQWGRERIYNMVAGRPDWCISRQRSWGVPIPAFYCTACETALAVGDVMRHVAELFAKEGSDAWWKRPASELLPAGTKCGSCGGTEFGKENDILDVWFESGVSYAAVYAGKPRSDDKRHVDLYLEGSDQHRGWFHSALLCAVGSEGRAPYEAVLTHGFVVDGQGKKISKSKGNFVDPQKVIGASGAELIRLWVAAEDYREDVRVSDEILSRLSDAYRKIRNTLRFLLGNLHGFDALAHAKYLGDDADPASFDILDQYALHLSETLSRKVQKAYSEYQYHQVFHALNEFCSVELSAFYLDVLKDRLYVESDTSPIRVSAQRALWNITHDLLRLAAPILAFTSDEAWQLLGKAPGMPAVVHLADLPKQRDKWLNDALAGDFASLSSLRQVALKSLETARQEKIIGSGLEAKVTLRVTGDRAAVALKYQAELPVYFIVSAVDLHADVSNKTDSVVAEVARAPGSKCGRCWGYREGVGAHAAHPMLCTRCERVVTRATGLE